MTTTTTSAPIGTELHAGDDASTWSRIAGVCGILAAVLWFGMGAAVASGAPYLGDSAEEIRTWMQDNQGQVATFTCGMGLTMVLLLAFGAGFRGRLAQVDRAGYLHSLFFGALVANVAGGLVGLSFWGVLSNDVGNGLSDDLVVALSALDTVFFFALLPWAFTAMLIAASIVIVQTRIMPVWLGGLGIVCGIAYGVSTLWLVSGDPDSFLAQGPGFIGMLGSLLWIAIVGGYMVRGDRS